MKYKISSLMTRKILGNSLLAILSGTTFYFASPGPHAFPLLAFVGAAPLLFLCRGETPKAACGYGLIAGLSYYLPLLSFITIVLGTYGGMDPWLARLAMVLLALYMSLYTAFFAGLASWCGRFFSPLWIAPVLWVALDFIRSFLFTGFPWMDAGYSLFSLPLLIQTASLFGHHGLTFLLVLTGGVIAESLFGNSPVARLSEVFEGKEWVKKGPEAELCSAEDLFSPLTHPSETVASRSRENFQTGAEFPPEHKLRRPATGTIAALLLLVTALGASPLLYRKGETSLANATTIPVAVVQGNIEQNQKWDPALVDETVRTYERLSRQALETDPTALVIWPETALPFFPLTTPAFSELLERFVIPNQVWLLTGAPHMENPQAESSPLFNRAFLVNPEGVIMDFYDKQHLVPFGEYVPFRKIFKSFSPVVETMTDFSPGERKLPMPCGKLRIGVLICFESIFPEISREQAADGANFLITITNDAWFGRSNAPWQHLAMGVLRAVETGKSLARAANTGVSGLIDPLGRITVSSPLFETWQHTDRLPVLENQTFFVQYGYLFPHLCLALTAGLIAASWRRSERKRKTED